MKAKFLVTSITWMSTKFFFVSLRSVSLKLSNSRPRAMELATGSVLRRRGPNSRRKGHGSQVRVDHSGEYSLRLVGAVCKAPNCSSDTRCSVLLAKPQKGRAASLFHPVRRKIEDARTLTPDTSAIGQYDRDFQGQPNCRSFAMSIPRTR
jgi:hypothetical protein